MEGIFGLRPWRRAPQPNDDVEFMLGDAEALPFADDAFDVALGALIVNHLPHPEQAASELTRVAKRVALAMWGPEDEVGILGCPPAPPATSTPTSRPARTRCASRTRGSSAT
jgi:ubiquinone/menaquinone biosynthesis C-methylase UbiE